MAKKTKKEKILAEYRRKMKILSPPPPKPQSPTTIPVTIRQLVDQSPITLPDSHYTPLASSNPGTDYAYVLSDLKRILLLTALAICAQFVLWYVLRK